MWLVDSAEPPSSLAFHFHSQRNRFFLTQPNQILETRAGFCCSAARAEYHGLNSRALKNHNSSAENCKSLRRSSSSSRRRQRERRQKLLARQQKETFRITTCFLFPQRRANPTPCRCHVTKDWQKEKRSSEKPRSSHASGTSDRL